MDKRAEKYLEGLGFPLEGLDGWKIEVAKRAGVDVAIVATKGTEIHFVSLSEGKAMSRLNTREFLAPLLDEYGYATTRVPIAVTNHKLRERLGFTQTWHDANFTYWVLTEMPFPRSTT